MLHFLFPEGSDRGTVDEMFADQLAALTKAGFAASPCPESAFAGAKPLRCVPTGSTVVYRGWMVTAEEYAALTRAIEQSGATPFISQTEYLTAHHLPRWYQLVPDLT